MLRAAAALPIVAASTRTSRRTHTHTRVHSTHTHTRARFIRVHSLNTLALKKKTTTRSSNEPCVLEQSDST